MGSVSSVLVDHDGLVANIKVSEVFVFESHCRAEALAHDAVPRRPVELIHMHFDG